MPRSRWNPSACRTASRPGLGRTVMKINRVRRMGLVALGHEPSQPCGQAGVAAPGRHLSPQADRALSLQPGLSEPSFMGRAHKANSPWFRQGNQGSGRTCLGQVRGGRLRAGRGAGGGRGLEPMARTPKPFPLPTVLHLASISGVFWLGLSWLVPICSLEKLMGWPHRLAICGHMKVGEGGGWRRALQGLGQLRAIHS